MMLHGMINGRRRKKLAERFESGIGFVNPERDNA
jgi:hypothetical protein